MNYQDALTKLRNLKQEHLLAYWPQLSSAEQKDLLQQIQELNFDVLQPHASENPTSFEPLNNFQEPTDEDRLLGQQLLAEGKVGCLLIAGGQGSRLRFNGPKGFYPVTSIKQKSLFQVFAEKTAAASKQVGRHLPLAIMTSPANHEDTQRFFFDHHYFGLHPEQVHFFIQGSMPFLNTEGQLFLETPSKIAEGPDGNGGSLERFVTSGLWQHWQDQGITYLNYVLIDNPLADPFDARLIGNLARNKNQVAIKAIARTHPNEKVGILVQKNGRVDVIEYSEMPEEEAKARLPSGQLKYNSANISLFAFTMDFVKTASEKIHEMPLHKAYKAVQYLKSDGKTELSEKPNAWKYEKFIFDVLTYAKTVSVLVYKREECFAPLKNLENVEEVKQALQKRDGAIIQELVGKDMAKMPIELAQQFYYPTDELREKWKGKKEPVTGYIEEHL